MITLKIWLGFWVKLSFVLFKAWWRRSEGKQMSLKNCLHQPFKIEKHAFFKLASHEITHEKCLWRIKLFAGRPYPRNTRDNQLLPSIMTLRIPIMCWAHASLRRKASRELPVKTPLIFNKSWVFTLSLTYNPYNEIPHKIQGTKDWTKLQSKLAWN